MHLHPDHYHGIHAILGPPGTGKTQYLADLVYRLMRGYDGPVSETHSPVLICSLTRAAAAEIAGRTPDLPKSAVATIHAHGWRSQGCPAVVEKEDLEEWNRRHPGLALTVQSPGWKPDVEDVVEEPVFRGVADQLAAECHRLRHSLVPESEWPLVVRKFSEPWEAFKVETGKIDFTNMIEFAESRPPLDPRMIIVDEAQDTSQLCFNLLKRWADVCGAMILVGDPWQSLYVWAGADPSLLLDGQISHNRRSVLEQSHRVPSSVHQRAMNLVRKHTTWAEIEYRPRHGVGDVVTSCATRLRPAPLLEEIESFVYGNKTVMIMASCKYMLRVVERELRKYAIPFSNPWRAKQKEWNPLLRKDNASVSLHIDVFLKISKGLWTARDCLVWAKRTVPSRYMIRDGLKLLGKMAMDDPKRILSIADMVDLFILDKCLELFGWIEAYRRGEATAGPGLEWLAGMCRGPAAYAARVASRHGVEILQKMPHIHLGTVHSFKGGEADHVYLFPDLSHTAWYHLKCGPREQHDAVIRQFYVGMTRAREVLHLCRPANRRKFIRL